MSTEKKGEKIASCDSQVLMWSLPWAMTEEKKTKKKGGQDVAVMRQRAGWLMGYLADKGIDLYIPSLVVAELIGGVPIDRHAKLVAEFSRRFQCPPFDAKACALAARLWQFERGLTGHSDGLPDAERSTRRVLKADMQIVASAKEAGATHFYSHDKKCRRLAAEAGMTAKDLPESSGALFQKDGDNSDDWPS